MRALIVQFESDDAPEHLGRRLSAHHVDWEAAKLYLRHEPLSLDGYDMLFALGGAMGAHDALEYPFLTEAAALLRAAVARRLPCLGICLGGQMLATALGAPVTRQREKEVGVSLVTLTPDGHDDPLLHDLGPDLETVQFHEDTFGVPEGGAVLATSALCATQIVRCAARAYAVQFHPEVSWHTFAGWIEQGYAAFAGSAHAGDGARLVEQVRSRDAIIRAHADALLDNFLRLADA